MMTVLGEHELRPLLAHVAAFARIVNASQTRQLLEWDAESLQRALQWARFLERGTRACGPEAAQALDALLERALPALTLPSFARTGAVMSTLALQNGAYARIGISTGIGCRSPDENDGANSDAALGALAAAEPVLVDAPAALRDAFARAAAGA